MVLWPSTHTFIRTVTTPNSSIFRADRSRSNSHTAHILTNAPGHRLEATTARMHTRFCWCASHLHPTLHAGASLEQYLRQHAPLRLKAPSIRPYLVRNTDLDSNGGVNAQKIPDRCFFAEPRIDTAVRAIGGNSLEYAISPVWELTFILLRQRGYALR